MDTQIYNKLKIFHDIMKTFPQTKYPIANLFLANICNIKMELMQWIVGNLVSSYAIKMVEKFDKYWAQIHGIMCVVTILDPKYMIKLLKYCLSFYNDEIAKIEVGKVQNIIMNYLLNINQSLTSVI